MKKSLRSAVIATAGMAVGVGLAGLASAQAAPAPETVQTLVGRYSCLTCHGMVHKQVGPGFAQIADRYRNDAAAPARLAGKIRNGGVGEWGRVIMPRQPHMAEAESLVLANWVLAQPSPPR
ncbi:MAG: cytochrome [Variovorax sp.]|nr:cytochrome [Variovorax sp.]